MTCCTPRRLPARIGSNGLRFVILAAALVAGGPVFGQQAAGEHWVGTWATANVGRPQTPPSSLPPAPPAQATPPQPAPVPAPPAPFLHFNNQTLRQIVHTSIGGSRVRVVLSNTFGTAPLTIGSGHVALREKRSAIVAALDGPVAFGGP